MWKITPLFAEWIASPQHIFLRSGVLDSTSTVVELGCGVSGTVGLMLVSRVGRYIATEYVLRHHDDLVRKPTARLWALCYLPLLSLAAVVPTCSISVQVHLRPFAGHHE